MPAPRKTRLVPMIREVLEESSGMDLASAGDTATFLEMGLDSLFLTQSALSLQKKFGVKVTFRQLNEDLSTLDALAGFIDSKLAADKFPAPAEAAAPVPVPVPAPAPAPVAAAPTPQAYAPAPVYAPAPQAYAPAPTQGFAIDPSALQGVHALMAQQLALMQQQVALLQGAGAPAYAAPIAIAPPVPVPVPVPAPAASASAPAPAPAPAAPAPAAAAPEAPKKAFGPQTRIDLTKSSELTSAQQAYIDQLTARYNKKTPKSKQFTQDKRAKLADPRVVSGFRPTLKEITYPVVVDRSAGSRLWDLDGNEYVDLTCGFGSAFFGHSPPFVAKAVQAQIGRGWEVGPQHPLAGEIAERFTRMVGHDRVAFCNTGSEAVLGATRIARTVTGRSMIAVFTGAYHGIFDEVIVRPGKNNRAMAASAGITREAVGNVLMVDFDSDDCLAILEQHADDLAAVLVEPVQSRRPDLQPKELLQKLRAFCTRTGAALIMDEVICGFRITPGGAQEHFGVKGDLATYGKIFGGGMPVGAIAGKTEWMDALDGGHWTFGDDSFPSVGVTYFAGTFIRHPLAMAASQAVFDVLEQGGPKLQADLNKRTDVFLDELRAHFYSVGAPVKVPNFGSVFKIGYPDDAAYGGLLFHALRDRGIHVWEGRPCFLSTAHTDEDLKILIKAFKEAVAELQAVGFLPTKAKEPGDAKAPPVPGARLGRDPDGRPAWYAPDPERPGKYVRVGAQ